MPQYIELTEKPPCPTCGEYLRQFHAPRFVPLGEQLTGIKGPEQITYLGDPRCPNGCAETP